MVLDAEERIEPPLREATDDLAGRLPEGGEPEGLRRVTGGPVRLRDAGDHTVRRCARRAPLRGSGGCAPGRPVRERPGVRRGAEPPLASTSVDTLCMLA